MVGALAVALTLGSVALAVRPDARVSGALAVELTPGPIVRSWSAVGAPRGPRSP